MIKDLLILSFLLLGIDSIYLYSSQSYFQKQIKIIQNSQLNINYIGAGLCYLFLVLSVYYFIISENKKPLDSFILGLCIYGVFEYTNYALFKNWFFFTTILDTLWGGILFFLTAYIFYFLKNKKIL